MELGGNKPAKAFYEKNGMLPAGQAPDHLNPALSRYKNDLKLRAENALGVVQSTQAEPVAKAEKKVELFGEAFTIPTVQEPKSEPKPIELAEDTK